MSFDSTFDAKYYSAESSKQEFTALEETNVTDFVDNITEDRSSSRAFFEEVSKAKVKDLEYQLEVKKKIIYAKDSEINQLSFDYDKLKQNYAAIKEENDKLKQDYAITKQDNDKLKDESAKQSIDCLNSYHSVEKEKIVYQMLVNQRDSEIANLKAIIDNMQLYIDELSKNNDTTDAFDFLSNCLKEKDSDLFSKLIKKLKKKKPDARLSKISGNLKPKKF